MLGVRTRSNYLPRSVFPSKERVATICMGFYNKMGIVTWAGQRKASSERKQIGRNLLAPWLQRSHISQGFSPAITEVGGDTVQFTFILKSPMTLYHLPWRWAFLFCFVGGYGIYLQFIPEVYLHSPFKGVVGEKNISSLSYTETAVSAALKKQPNSD